MQIDPKKLKRQNQVINKWLKNKACGTLQATTGFGKTYVALMTIQRMNERNAERTTLVVVPTQYLKSQWEEQVENLGLLHVTVLVINTAIKVNREFDLLVLDEIGLAAHWKLLSVKDVLELLDKVPEETTVVMTGRLAPKELADRADFVNAVQQIKMPKDFKLTEGIQY